ncbi:MAG TPA: MFS transporter [Chloroflexota bacterium]
MPGSPDGERAAIFTADFIFANIANFFVSLGQQMLIATLPVYIISLGGTPAQAGLVTGAAAITALLARPLSGWLVDAWRRRPVVLLGCVFYTVASLTYLLSGSVAGLGLGRVFHGFALSNYTTAANTYVADIAPRARRAEAIGFFAATADVGLITGPAVGFAIATAFSFHELFLASMAMALLALLSSAFAREHRQPSGADRPPWSPRTGLISFQALPQSWIAFCLGMGIGPLNTFLSIFATSRGIQNPGFYFTVQAGALLLTRGFAGRLADRRGRAFVIVPGTLAGALAIALLPLAFDLPHFLISAVLWGVGLGAAQPASLALLVDRSGGTQRGLALSTYFMGFDIGIGAGAIALGFISQWFGWGVMWPVSAAAVLLGLLGMAPRRTNVDSRTAPA